MLRPIYSRRHVAKLDVHARSRHNIAMRITNLHSRAYAQFTEKIRPGDIGAVVETGLVGRLSARFILPSTDFFHFFLVADYIPLENDYVIYESIPSHGVSVGRLSWYLPFTVAIFRPNTDEVLSRTILKPEELGRRAVWQATKFGRCKYDYRLCAIIMLRTFWGCFRNLSRGKGFYIDFTEIPFSKDKRLLCTEMVDEAYNELFPVFDRRYELLPANFLNSYLEANIDHVCGWTGK